MKETHQREHITVAYKNNFLERIISKQPYSILSDLLLLRFDPPNLWSKFRNLPLNPGWVSPEYDVLLPFTRPVLHPSSRAFSSLSSSVLVTVTEHYTIKIQDKCNETDMFTNVDYDVRRILSLALQVWMTTPLHLIVM